MTSTLQIQLNFLPVIGELPHFAVYRSLRQGTDAKPDAEVYGFSLPVTRGDTARADYWVRFTPHEGYEKFVAHADDNFPLARRAMFLGLCEAANAAVPPEKFTLRGGGFLEEINFNLVEHAEGHEQLSVQPYYLRSQRAFGWLADFHFHVREGVSFSRRIQQLSLSLDHNYKRNLDCYLDRTRKVAAFLQARRHVIDAVKLPGSLSTLKTSTDFLSLPATPLRPKTYLFAGNRESRSQFTGLRQYGPLEPLSAPPHLLFAFRERDRQAARTLAMALQGSKKRERFSFPGFEALFKSTITIDSAPIVLPDLSTRAFMDSLARVKAQRETHPSTVPVFVLPDGDDNGYMAHKAVFTHEGIATQVCTLKIINDDYALKWAIANIALQIFCKAGGHPWKVRPTAERTLIIGISQSHKLRKDDGRTNIERYFAFSVMTDNSGLFQQLRVLGDSQERHQYLQGLSTNLQAMLAERSSDFAQVVIHTSFRLKHDEMITVEKAVKAAATDSDSKRCRFAVVKVNHRNRFFGVNPEVNSLVPYEGTTLRLGGGEHLIWFEGIFPDKQTVTKAFPGPTHVHFLRVSQEDAIADDALLQDLVNLSGANWRGFNAKSAPVSVFYCHLVADLVHDFQSQGLPLPRVQDLRPWFL